MQTRDYVPSLLSDPSCNRRFTLEGTFLGFEPHPEGKRKYIYLATLDGEHRIKLEKPLRYAFGLILHPGQQIRIQGRRKHKSMGEVKWIAEDLQILEALSGIPSREAEIPLKEDLPKLGTVQLCLKSDCCRRGAKTVLDALQKATQGIPVEIKTTGCMKKCESGPNLVVLPAKARYQRVTPEQAVTLVHTHFPENFQGSPSRNGYDK